MASPQQGSSPDSGYGTSDFYNNTILAQNQGMPQHLGSCHHGGRGGSLHLARGRINSPYRSGLGFHMNAPGDPTPGIRGGRGMPAGQHMQGRGMGTPMIQTPGNVPVIIAGDTSMNSYGHADEPIYQTDTSV